MQAGSVVDPGKIALYVEDTFDKANPTPGELEAMKAAAVVRSGTFQPESLDEVARCPLQRAACPSLPGDGAPGRCSQAAIAAIGAAAPHRN